MAKKALSLAAANLSQLAVQIPTQYIAPQSEPRKETRKEDRTAIPKKVEQPTEPTLQFSFELRESLRKELMLLATELDMTMRAFVLSALKAKGLQVTDADLVDTWKQKG